MVLDGQHGLGHGERRAVGVVGAEGRRPTHG
jgi:hypothetical protein